MCVSVSATLTDKYVATFFWGGEGIWSPMLGGRRGLSLHRATIEEWNRNILQQFTTCIKFSVRKIKTQVHYEASSLWSCEVQVTSHPLQGHVISVWLLREGPTTDGCGHAAQQRQELQ